MDFELELWRATSLELRAGPFLNLIGPALQGAIEGFELLCLWRWDAEERHLWRLGSCGPAGAGVSLAAQLAPPQAVLGELADGGPATRRTPRLARWLAETSGGRAPVVRVLVDQRSVVGVAALWTAGSDAAAARIEQLADPLTAVVRHHVTLRELDLARKGAVAARDAALARLNRPNDEEELVGAGGGLAPLVDEVRRVAPLDVPVLLLGETGSGKEVVARRIHAMSARASGPMVRVNCGAIPPELVDSELFGHERGSFTGAFESREGWFERADGGTLLLDEVGDLPPAAQVRLLRVLQEGEVTRVGGARARGVDVRVVAATHRDLESMVAAGTFRQDLWFRLSVYPIRIPPLRERLGDVPSLARFFAARSAGRLGAPPIEPTTEDVRALCDYDWPGNVRELAAVIERATILGDGRRLELGRALGRPAASSGAQRRVAGQASGERERPAPAAADTFADPDRTLDAAVRRHIERVLSQTGGRIEGASGAAELLGMAPSTLRSTMRRVGASRAQASAPKPTIT